MQNGHRFQLAVLCVQFVVGLIVWLSLRAINVAESNITDATRDIRANSARIGAAEVERAAIRAEIENLKERQRETTSTVNRQWNAIRELEVRRK